MQRLLRQLHSKFRLCVGVLIHSIFIVVILLFGAFGVSCLSERVEYEIYVRTAHGTVLCNVNKLQFELETNSNPLCDAKNSGLPYNIQHLYHVGAASISLNCDLYGGNAQDNKSSTAFAIKRKIQGGFLKYSITNGALEHRITAAMPSWIVFVGPLSLLWAAAKIMEKSVEKSGTGTIEGGLT